jgi:hypothetical protein
VEGSEVQALALGMDVVPVDPVVVLGMSGGVRVVLSSIGGVGCWIGIRRLSGKQFLVF